ncbi:synaptotagmin-like protein 1 isoform X2 [Pristis pectinata]|nr:synaptotagmin-like protein 1 isoform X2 [Pristis pectinata]XP_051880647.1 synaptotagmin-like protein 1 isoform X2 [Pristis pectinata]XP_051880648.1 synaptotagmin-like protein 1 isoform X2 [Pristis pectinata]
MKTELDLTKMMDLSFLSEDEQMALQKVLKRDADLKKLEERRIRKLKKSNYDTKKLKVMTGEWFNEVKAKRYGDIVSGIDLLKKSFNRKKTPVVPDVAVMVSQDASVLLSQSPPHPDSSTDPEKRLLKESKSLPQTEMMTSKSHLQAPTGRREVKDEAETWKGDIREAQSKRSNQDYEDKSTSPGTEVLLSNSDSFVIAIDEPMSEINPYTDFSISQPSRSAKEAQFWTVGEAQNISVDFDVLTDSSLTRSAQPGFSRDETDAPRSPGLSKQIDYFKPSPTAMDDSRIAYNDVEIVQNPEKNSDSMRGLSSSKKNYPSADMRQKNPRNSATLLSEILQGGNKPPKDDIDYAIESNTEPLQNAVEGGVVSESPDTGSLFSSRPSSVEDSTKSNASTWKGQYGDNNVDRNYEPGSSTGLMSNTSRQIRKPGEYYNDVPNITLGKGESESSKRKGILKRSPSTSSTESENFSKLISIRSTEDIGVIPQQSDDFRGNSMIEAGSKQVRFSTKMKNELPSNIVEGWKTDNAPNSSIAMNEDNTMSQEEENNDDSFSSLSPAGRYETKPYENLYLINKGTTEHFLEPQWRENSEALHKNEQVPDDDPSDFSVKINKPTSSSEPSGATVPILTSNDPHSEEYDYFEDVTSESSFGSDILKQTDVQVSSNLKSSKLSGSLLSLYSDAGDFGDVPVQGAVQFKLRYEEAKKEFQIHVEQCRGLAAANIRKYTSDPYVKTYLLPDRSRPSKRKTSVKKATLNPQYNEILKYKIQKQELQNRTLNLSVWHNDTLGRNVFLGETEVEMSKWDWRDNTLNWYNLEPKPSCLPEGNINQGEIHVALKYIPADSTDGYKSQSGEVHIWLKGATELQPLKPGGVDSFVRCYILPDTSKKSRQKTRVVKKNLNPIYNHTMVYDGFKLDEIMEASAELSIWDHETFTNQFLGGVRLNLGTGNSYGQNVDWMDSNEEEAALWKDMISKPNEWVEAVLPLRPTMTKRK